MKCLAKVHILMPAEEGVSKVGNYYSKQTLVVIPGMTETFLAIEFFGDSKVAALKNLQPGDIVEVTYKVESRAVGSGVDMRWFTSVSGISIRAYIDPERKAAATNSRPAQTSNDGDPLPADNSSADNTSEDDSDYLPY